jgi:hypothetical protein
MGIREDLRNKTKENSILARIRAGIANQREISWPGNPDVKLRVRILSAMEITDARFENQQEFKSRGVDVAVHNLPDYREQEADHALWRALLDSDGNRIFSSADDFRKFCSREEIKVFADEYTALSAECDPDVGSMSESEMQNLCDFLKKKPELIRLNVSSLRTAWRLLDILVGQSQSSQTPNG